MKKNLPIKKHSFNVILKCCLAGLLLLAAPFTKASLVGPYTPDANTLFLLHFDEATGGSVTTNVGSLGGNFISVNYSSDSLPLPVVTTMLGATSYSINSPASINFSNCEDNTTSGYEFGYDYNRDDIFEGDNGSGTSVDFITMNKLNIGNGGQTPFTLEANIQPTSTSGNQEIICTDSQNKNRGFQFRISSGALMFQFITGSQALSYTIPTTGPNAFVANAWFHVAFTYDGTNGTIYWTRLDPSIGAANVLGSGPLTVGASDGTVTGPLVIGNRGRPNGVETFLGSIDEVRISNVARAANQMQFFSLQVTITQNPISQNVDYNQPVTFTVGATTTGNTLSYQWLFNSNSIVDATNAVYTIPALAADNAGFYDCVVTNSLGYSATSSVAQLVVGAANFLYHRYSFLTNANDSVGTANGTLFGDATATNGILTLDGTAGTYMQLPANIVNGANQTAFTIEAWATYGVNANNAYLFNFGTVNNFEGHAYLGYSPHNAAGQEQFIAAGDASTFNQTNPAPGTLDGLTMHVACVYDPPNQTMAIYTNGVLEAINTNMTVGMANINDVYSYIGASLKASDPHLVANINELRLYSGALSPLSLAQSDVLGPTQVLAYGPVTFARQPVSNSTPLGQTATFSAAATGYLPITYQWFENGTPLPGATNATYSFVPTLDDNNDSFVCYATNTIGDTTYSANSTTAMLSVFLPPTLSWLGTSAGGQDQSWNTTSLDWINDLNGGGIIAFAQTNGVLFDDRSGGGTVDLEQAINPYNITVNAASAYQFTSSSSLGSLTGLGSLTKQNSGTLTIDLTNTLSGSTTISGGVLQVGNSDSYGSLGSGPVTNNATLSFNRSDTGLNVGNSIHGTGTVSFDGAGAVTISGNNDYSGSTLLNAGTVYLTSSTGFGDTTGANVASGAKLYINANINLTQPLTLNGAGPLGAGALEEGGTTAAGVTAPIYLAGATTIGVDSGSTLTLSNVISGSAALTAIGGGVLALNANNSFNGGFVLNNIVVDINATGAVGSGPVTVSGAGRLVLASGLNFTNSLDATIVNPGANQGILMVNDNTNGIITTISGPIEFDDSPSSGGNFVGPASSGYLNITGPIVNNATGLIISRSGFIRYSGGGSYLTFDLAGTASIGANNGLCPNAILNMGVSGNATFDLNGFSQALAGLNDGGAYTGLVTNSGASLSTLTLNMFGATTTYSNTIAGNVTLVINGSGSLYLAGINAYTGNTTVNGGTLEIAQPTLAARSTVAVASGAMLQLDFTTTNIVSGLMLNGVSQPLGVYNNTTAPAYISGSGSLQVAVTVVTNPTNILATVTGGNLVLSWPTDHIGWHLQAQTNSLANGLGTNWVNVPNTSMINSFTNSINPVNGAVFYRLTYP